VGGWWGRRRWPKEIVHISKCKNDKIKRKEIKTTLHFSNKN
jgi:hypothetical protein